MPSTVKEKYYRTELSIIKFPIDVFSVLVGLLLSDGWLNIGSSCSKIYRLGFKQSATHSAYVWFVFSILSHYCSRYPSVN